MTILCSSGGKTSTQKSLADEECDNGSPTATVSLPKYDVERITTSIQNLRSFKIMSYKAMKGISLVNLVRTYGIRLLTAVSLCHNESHDRHTFNMMRDHSICATEL